MVRQIASLGYDCRWCTISAASIGALHKRERWFLLAHFKHTGTFASQDRQSIREKLTQRQQQQQKEDSRKVERASCLPSNVAHSKSKSQNGLPKREAKRQPSTRINSEYATIDEWQKAVSEMGKLSNGIPNHMARLKALGNAVVPQQARKAFEILMGIEC